MEKKSSGVDKRRLQIEPVTKDLLFMKVADAIARYIQQNGLRVGDKLPAERALAKEFATGRNTVRDALRALEKEGVLEIRVGAGAFVAGEYHQDGELEVKLMKVDYRDLLEIKIWLEKLVIKRAAVVATEKQLQELGAIADELNGLAQNGMFSLSVDRRFHTKLSSCAGSDTLAQLMLNIVDALDDYSGVLGDGGEAWVRTVPYHVELVTALREGNLGFALAAHEYIHKLDLSALDAMGKPNT